jgi:hypothetical protein
MMSGMLCLVWAASRMTPSTQPRCSHSSNFSPRWPPLGDVISFYIAVPAAMRISVPAANPTLSLAASLGVTFPFNVLVGIPLYHAMATQAFALTGGTGS